MLVFGLFVGYLVVGMVIGFMEVFFLGGVVR